MGELARALQGCDATVTGWHVPAFERGLILLRVEEAVERPMLFMGAWCDTIVRYRPNLRPDRAVCPCGWRPTEEAIMAIEAQVQTYLDGGGGPSRIIDLVTGRPRARARQRGRQLRIVEA